MLAPSPRALPNRAGSPEPPLPHLETWCPSRRFCTAALADSLSYPLLWAAGPEPGGL